MGRRKLTRKIVTHLLLLPFLIFALFPFYHMMLTSLKQDRELYDRHAVPLIIKQGPTLEHYSKLLWDTEFLTWTKNSLLVTVLATSVSVLIGTIAAYALARPDVRFELTLDGKRALATDGAGDRLNAIVGVHGAEVATQMLPLDPDVAEVPGVTVSGYVSAPALNRAHRQGILIFVNGRWVQNRALGFALEEAYHSLLMIGRHPLAVVDLRLDPALLDKMTHASLTGGLRRRNGGRHRSISECSISQVRRAFWA